MLSYVALFSLVTYVSAGGLFGNLNWGCPSSIASKAPATVKNQCSSKGSFMMSYKDSAICCSFQTRVPPSSQVTCPISWSMHKTQGCCVPPAEVHPCDCGEGFNWGSLSLKCSGNQSPKCNKSQWYHDRSDSCCENSWGSNPPSGTCPDGITCPSDWFWHKDLKKCKPNHPRSPHPDCSNWNDHDQCCGSHQPTPSAGTGSSSGSNGQQGGDHNSGSGQHQGGKRDFLGRQQMIIGGDFPQSDLDKIYCPKGLHACSVVVPSGGEWSYECIDPATELESCGGCASSGTGQDCTAIPNAVSVGCESGSCSVYTCKSGYSINGTLCSPS